MTDNLEAIEHLIQEVNELSPEVLQSTSRFADTLESFISDIEAQRLRNNIIPIAGFSSSSDTLKFLTDPEKQNIRLKAHNYIRNPMVENIVQQYVTYSFGNGLDMPETNNPEIKKVFSTFWNHPDNKLSVTTLTSQQKIARRMFTDGEIFLVFFVSFYTGNLRVRLFNSEILQDVVTDPDDKYRNICYKITDDNNYTYDFKNGIKKVKNYKKSKFKFYIDYNNVNWKETFIQKRIVPIIGKDYIPRDKIAEGIVYLHPLNIDAEEKRGVPLLSSIIGPIDDLKQIINDERTYSRSLLTFAMKKTVSDVPANLLRNYVNANRPTTLPDGRAQNSMPPVGSTHVSSKNVSLEPMEVSEKGSEIFEKLRRTILNLIASGSGLTMSNITNDTTYGALSKDDSLELSQLARFSSFQYTIKEVYENIINLLLTVSIASHKIKGPSLLIQDDYCTIINTNTDLKYQLSLPSIINRNLNTLTTSLSLAVKQLGLPREVALSLYLKEFDLTKEDVLIFNQFSNNNYFENLTESEKHRWEQIRQDLLLVINERLEEVDYNC